MRIAVIGGAGRMGRVLLRYFSDYDTTLVASDPKKEGIKDLAVELGIEIADGNRNAALGADVVIVSVPMESTAAVVQEVASSMKRNAILCEISSIKAGVLGVLKGLKDRGVRPLSLHPLFGQGACSTKRKVALIPVLTPEEELRTAKGLFPDCDFIAVDQEEHDKAMALTISLPYFVNLVIASILQNQDVVRLQELGGTTFETQLLLTGSVMANSCALHRSLQINNKEARTILRRFLESASDSYYRLYGEHGDFDAFCRSTKSKLGESVNLDQKYAEMYSVLDFLHETKTSEGV